MKVFITGVTGFLGSALAQQLERAGHVVSGSSTRPERSRRPELVVRHVLGQHIDPKWLDGVEVLIHAAWDLTPGAGSVNRASSARWREAAARAGTYAIFISTFSAYPDFPSEYGRDKCAVEAAFTGAGAAVVRPALVAGGGGLFAQLVRQVATARLLPLPDGGRHHVELVDVRDVTEALTALASRRSEGAFDLSAGRLPLSAVCRAIAAGLQRPAPIILPIPIRPVLGALAVTARFGIGSAFRERLVGYLENDRRRRTSCAFELLGRAPLAPARAATERAREALP